MLKLFSIQYNYLQYSKIKQEMENYIKLDVNQLAGMIEKNKDKIFKYSEVSIIKSDSYNTACMMCNRVCHFGCYLNECKTLGHEYFKGCFAFNDITAKKYCEQIDQVVSFNEILNKESDKIVFGSCYACGCEVCSHVHIKYQYNLIPKFDIELGGAEIKNSSNKTQTFIENIEKLGELVDKTTQENVKQVKSFEVKIKDLISLYDLSDEIKLVIELITKRMNSNVDPIVKEALKNLIETYKRIEQS